MGLFWGRSWGDPAPTPHRRVPWKLSCRPLCRKGRVRRCRAGAAPLSVSRRSMGAGLLGETPPVALAPWGPRRRRDGGSRGEQQSGGHPLQDRQAEPSSLTLPSTGGLQGLLGGGCSPTHAPRRYGCGLTSPAPGSRQQAGMSSGHTVQKRALGSAWPSTRPLACGLPRPAPGSPGLSRQGPRDRRPSQPQSTACQAW